MSFSLKDPKVGIGVAAGLLLAALLIMIATNGASTPDYRRVTKKWYYDLNTQTLFEAPLDAVPPIDAPSGKPADDGEPAGVLALVFGCGDCSDPYTGFLQKYTSEGKRLMEAGDHLKAAKLLLVRAVDGGPWVPKDVAGDIVRPAMTRCGKGVRVMPCNE